MPLMDKDTRELITIHLPALVEEIDLNPALWVEFQARRVVTKTQKEDIIRNDRNTSTQQKTILLELLPKRGQDKFVEFCLALVATEQEQIVTEILGLGIDDLRQQQLSYSSSIGGYPVGNPGGGDGPGNNIQGATTPAAASPSGSSDAPPDTHSAEMSAIRKRNNDREPSAEMKRFRPDSPHESEGDEMELTDSWGLRTEPVITSTEHFYQTHSNPDHVYPMYLSVRGLVLIINVTRIGEDERRGTEVDCAQLTHLFRSLHFDVITYTDRDGLSTNEIITKVQTFYQHPYHKEANCVAMVFLSHGLDDVIFGTDGNAVPLSQLYTIMNSCQGLDNKPKLVLLEACGGFNYDDGRVTQSSLQGTDEEDAPKLPFMTDFFIGRPSQPGMRAHRNTVKGSWYIQAIVKAFTKYAATFSLPELMIKVNALVAKMESHSSDPTKNGKKQAPDGRLNLRRNIYFFPGIQRTHP